MKCDVIDTLSMLHRCIETVHTDTMKTGAEKPNICVADIELLKSETLSQNCLYLYALFHKQLLLKLKIFFKNHLCPEHDDNGLSDIFYLITI